MKRRFLSGILLTLLLALGAGVSVAIAGGGGGADDGSKVTICHAVGGNGNTGSGYSLIDVSKDSIVNGNGQLDPNGHGTHPDDIIPAFAQGSGPGNKTWGAFAGQGDASWIANNCAPPAGSTTPTDTTTTPTDTTTTPTETTPAETTTTTETRAAPIDTPTTTVTEPITTTSDSGNEGGNSAASAPTAPPETPAVTQTSETETSSQPASPGRQAKPNSNAVVPHHGVKASLIHKAHVSRKPAPTHTQKAAVHVAATVRHASPSTHTARVSRKPAPAVERLLATSATAPRTPPYTK